MYITFNDIDCEDRHFKISRDEIDESLVISIRNFGVLDPPVVLHKEGKFRIIFGFNRIQVLKNLGHGGVPAVVLPGIDAEWYIKYALLKCLKNETGPIGRLKLLLIFNFQS